jgi:hypothetical protein
VKYKGQEFTDAWSYTSTSLCIFMAWCLIKNRENLTYCP